MTRAELRAALRRRLEDAGASPLWDDATLDDALAAAMRSYGARFTKQAVASVVVAAGATQVPVVEPIDPSRIVRVLDAAGAVVPPAADGLPAGSGGDGQSWRWWDGTLIMRRPAAAGTWRIKHLAPRQPPATDAAQADILPGDEEIVLALAAAVALRRRAVEDAKRGLRPGPLPSLAALAQSSADRLLAARHRRAAGGWLS